MSDDVLGKATIMLVADQAGFTADMTNAARTVGQFEGAAVQAASNAATALTSIGTASGDAAESMSKSQKTFVESLQRQVAAMEGGKLAALELKAQQMGLADSVAPLIERMRQVEAAQKAAAAASAESAASHAAVVGAVAQLAESEDEATARIRAMVAASVEQTDALNKQNVASREAATAARELAGTGGAAVGGTRIDFSAQQRELQQTANEVAEVNRALGSIGQGASSMKDVQAQTDRLVSLWQSGRISAEQYDAAVKKLDASEAALGKSSALAAAQADQFIAKLRDQASVAGLTSKQLLEYRAAQLGLTAQAAPLIAQISAGSEAMHSFSLESAAAKRELAVMAREIANGNFGCAARSFSIFADRAGLLGTLLSPVGIGIAAVAAAIGGVAVAAVLGAKEQDAFNSALIITGNYAGTTADGLHALAVSAAATGGSLGTAKDAVAQLAGSGKFTADQIGMIAKAATLMQSATGQAVDVTVAQFEKLAANPAKAAAELSNQYHFLTAAEYEQIAALEKMGNATAAQKLVEEKFANALNDRTQQILQNQGFITRGWDAVKAAAGKAADAMLSVGKKSSASEQIADIDNELGAKAGRGAVSVVTGKDRDRLIQRRAALQADLDAANSAASAKAQMAQANDAKIQANVWMDSFRKEFATQAQKRDQEIREYKVRATSLGLTDAQQAADIANINGKYKDKSAKAYTDDAGTRMLQSLREQDASLQAQLAGQNKLTDAQKAQAQFEQQIADIKEKKILTADQKSLLANEAAIKAQLQENVAQAEKLRLKQEMEKLDQRSAQIDEAMRASLQGQQEQYSRTLDAFGMGKSAQEQVTALNQIQKEYQRYQEQLTKATPKDLLGTKQFQEDQDKIKAGLADSLKAYQDYYDQLRDKQGDWRTGAMQAFYDYQESARNVASQTQSAFASAFKGMEDAAVSFAMTGKLSFSDLARSVIADIVRIQARASIADASSSLLGSLFGSGTMLGNLFGTSSVSPATVSAANASDDPIGALIASFDGHAVGGYISGPGTGTSDSITARLSNGEFVNTAESTRKNRELLEWLNNGGDAANMPRFATGGLVGSAAAITAASDAGTAPQVNIINQTSTPMQATATRNADGGIDVLVRALEDRIAGNLASGQGSLYKTFRSGFGMKRTVA